MIKKSSHGQLLSERQAAEILSLSIKTLQRWRWARVGPPFSKLGRAVRYAEDDLEEFIRSGRRDTHSISPSKEPSTAMGPPVDAVKRHVLPRRAPQHP